MTTISIDFNATNDAKIAVVGCGGAGGNALNTMIQENLQYVSFIAINTDSQALAQNRAPHKIQIGQKTRKGLGCGARPECGFISAEEDEEKIREALEGNDMVFITAGLGGGTGTGSAPVVARIAKEMEILTVAVVTKPFSFEGKKKLQIAEMWIEELKKYVDSLIIISNQKIVETAGNISFLEGFKRADSILMSAVAGIADAITEAGVVNIDFADVKTILANSGQALIGVGYGSGQTKVFDAVKQAIENPLIENLTITGAGSILVNFRISPTTTSGEVDEASSYITQNAHEDAEIIVGIVFDPDLGDDSKVTIVATGFDKTPKVSSVPKATKEEKKIEVPFRNENLFKTEMKTPTHFGDTLDIKNQRETPPPLNAEKKMVLNVDSENKMITIDRDNLDIPTWIRRKKNKVVQSKVDSGY